MMLDIRFYAAVAYNSLEKSILLFGGWDGKKRIDNTFSFSNSEWKELHPSESPMGRNHSKMVYDAKNNRIILFGGHNGNNIFGDTWEFVNGNWNLILNTPTIKRIKNGH